jgi:hypothetical protein
MHRPQHECEEYDSTQLRSTQSQVLLLDQLCQENPTLLEGSHQSILSAWWAASAELGGWSCTHIPTSLEGKTHDAQLAEAV